MPSPKNRAKTQPKTRAKTAARRGAKPSISAFFPAYNE